MHRPTVMVSPRKGRRRDRLAIWFGEYSGGWLHISFPDKPPGFRMSFRRADLTFIEGPPLLTRPFVRMADHYDR